MSIDPGHAVAVLAIAAAVWAVRAYFWPFTRCRWCKDRRGRNAGSTSRRWGKCRFCDGKGERQILGSRTVHRVVRRGGRRH